MPLLVEAREADAQPAQHPRLSGAYLALAVKLQEAAGDMTASTVGQKLSAAIQAAHKGTGKWGSYLDHMGDDNSGDVIYSCSGDTMSCPYEIASNGDGVASTAKLDMDSARKVSPRACLVASRLAQYRAAAYQHRAQARDAWLQVATAAEVRRAWASWMGALPGWAK